MNKKLARSLRQNRLKQVNRYERESARRRAMRDQLARFSVSEISLTDLPALGTRLAGDADPAKCFWCGKRLAKKDLKAGRFYGLRTSRGGKYAIHLTDVFEDEDRTVRTPESERVIRESYAAIVKHEFREFRDLMDEKA